ncbi:MAG TPA: hypothetical protein VHE59_21280 [Mucilaginibacter sp.]|nr:hypothetical protein [Mucilaginibacter sp.]
MALELNHPLKVVLTNWIHFLGFYLCVEIFDITNLFTHYDSNVSWQMVIIGVLLGPLFLMLTYGLLIIAAFLVAIVCLDLIFFSIIKNKILLIVIIEWVLIIPIFIYWAFKYEYWLWLGLSVAFYITQYIRAKKVVRILRQTL